MRIQKRSICILIIGAIIGCLLASGIYAVASSVKFKMAINLKPSVYFALSLNINGTGEQFIFDNRATNSNEVVDWAVVNNLTLSLDNQALSTANTLELKVYNYNEGKYMSFDVYDNAGGVLSTNENGLKNIAENSYGIMSLKTNAVIDGTYTFKMKAETYENAYPYYDVYLNYFSIGTAYYNEDYIITLNYFDEYKETKIISVAVGNFEINNYNFNQNTNILTIPAQYITGDVRIVSDGVYPTYSVTLNNSYATTAGTTEVYYVVNTMEYFSTAECLDKISSIELPTKQQHKFEGYFTDINGGGTQYISSAGLFINNLYQQKQNLTLYAYWVEVTSVTVTLNNQNATSSGTQIIYFEPGINMYYSDLACTNSLSRISLPRKTEHRFMGYYSAIGGQSIMYIDLEGNFVNGLYNLVNDIMLYAYWVEGWDGVAATSFAGGTGTESNPWLITNAAELAYLANQTNSGTAAGQYYKQTKDIIINAGVMTEETTNAISWTPIGNNTNRFSGTYDGGMFEIRGIYISNANIDYQGLFGCNYGGTIKNVGVVNGYILGNNYVGGICASNYDAFIANCYNSNTIVGEGDYIGGICGDIGTSITGSSIVNNCFNSGSVTGYNSAVGGVSGAISGYYTPDNPGKMLNCYNVGHVKGLGNYLAGGLCGYASIYTIQNSYNAGIITHGNGITGSEERSANCTNIYYLSDAISFRAMTEADMKTTTFATTLGSAYWQDSQINNGFPYLVSMEMSGGSGTEVDPYKISNATQLSLLSTMVNGGYATSGLFFEQVADIYLNDGEVIDEDGDLNDDNWQAWTPIGTNTNKFSGTYDGGMFVVSGIYMNNETIEYQGLFGINYEGEIKNLGIVNGYINSTDSSVAVGGICGVNTGGTIKNCYNACTLAGTDSSLMHGVGGICGDNDSSTDQKVPIISECFNLGRISGCLSVGGIVGCHGDGSYSYKSTIINCYNAGSINCYNYSGGICGYYWSSTIENCYNVGTIMASSPGNFTCGIGGYDERAPVITNCYSLDTCVVDSRGSYFGDGTKKTLTEMQSQSLADLLNASSNPLVWGYNANKNNGLPYLLAFELIM